MNESLFVPLNCNICGNELTGGDNSRVFVCFYCKVAYIMEKNLETIPLKIYKSNFICEGELIYFPFYRLLGDFTLFSPDSKKMASYSKLKPLGSIFYPAFLNLRSLYSEDLTLKYALSNENFIEDNFAKNGKIAEVFLLPQNLEKIATLFCLSYLDRAADVTDVDIKFKLSSLDFSLIPFEKREDNFRELILGTVLKGFNF